MTVRAFLGYSVRPRCPEAMEGCPQPQGAQEQWTRKDDAAEGLGPRLEGMESGCGVRMEWGPVAGLGWNGPDPGGWTSTVKEEKDGLQKDHCWKQRDRSGIKGYY